jgi:hypothetical protein
MDFEAIIKGALTSLMNELRPVIQKQAERIQAQADHLAGLEAELAIVRQVVKSQEDENPDIAGIVSAAIAPLQKDLADVREEIEVVRAVKGEKGDRGDAGAPAELPDFTALMQKELGEYVQVITAQVNEGVRSTRTLAREEMKAELARVAQEAAEQVAVLNAALVEEGLTLSSTAYGSIFYIATGFHGLHVTGGLLAFLIVLVRVAKARRFTHEQATTAIVVSYYWHFVDVVWIALFSAIYLIK